MFFIFQNEAIRSIGYKGDLTGALRVFFQNLYMLLTGDQRLTARLELALDDRLPGFKQPVLVVDNNKYKRATDEMLNKLRADKEPPKKSSKHPYNHWWTGLDMPHSVQWEVSLGTDTWESVKYNLMQDVLENTGCTENKLLCLFEVAFNVPVGGGDAKI